MEYPVNDTPYPFSMNFNGEIYHAQWSVNGNQVTVHSEYGEKSTLWNKEHYLGKDQNGNFPPPSPCTLLFAEILRENTLK